MPSPIAHCSVLFIGLPAVRSGSPADLPRWRQWAALVALGSAPLVANMDFLAVLLLGRGRIIDHGTFTHSLLASLLFAFGFAAVCRVLLGQAFWRLWKIGWFCYAIHLLMDLCTIGRGIMVLWPFSTQRFVSPVPIFFGVRYSMPGAWSLHLITLVTEAGFALGVCLLVRWYVQGRGGKSPEFRAQPDTSEM